MNNSILFQHVQNSKLFNKISKEDINKLDDNFFVKKIYKTGDFVIKENDISSEVFIIISGTVNITKSTHEGKVVQITTRENGDVIGELGLIEQKLRSSNVICQTEVELLKIKKDNFFSILSLIPQVKINIIQIIASRFRESISQTGSEISKYQTMLELNQTIIAQKKELEKLNNELEQKNAELYKMAMTDQLTKINNRTFMMECFAKIFSNCHRHKTVFSCIIIDIDHFKAFNDNHGHLVGDFVLIKTAQLLKELIRKGDYLARYGGEEFLVILPYTSSENARIVAEKIRTTIAQTVYTYKKKTDLKVTVSLGVSDNLVKKPIDEYKMIKNADLALYKAKEKGRNQTILYSEIC